MLIVPFVLLAACSGGPGMDAGDGGDAAVPRWSCPSEWVPARIGGCGPAVILCAPDGGAADDACAGIDLTRPRTVTTDDGGMGSTFYRLPDGGIGGGWHEPGEPGGPPTLAWVPDGGGAGSDVAHWSPTAGISTCPTGWSRAADGSCDAALRMDCPSGSAALPTGTCTTTDDASCPAGTFPDPGAEAAGATLVRVLAGADAASADGSSAHPYPTIAAALSHLGSSGWVLIGAGSYPESLQPAGSVHLVGICAARVNIVAQAGAEAISAGRGSMLDVRAVTLTGAAGGAVAFSGGQLSLAHVAVRHATGLGVRSTGAGSQLRADDVFVTDTQMLPDASLGFGVYVDRGGMATMTHAAITSNRSVNVFGDMGGSLTIADSVVSDGVPTSAGTFGFGVSAQAGATVRADRVVVARNGAVGMFALGAGSRVTVNDATIVSTHPQADGQFGNGLSASDHASIVAQRVAVLDSRNDGVLSLGGGAVTVTEGVVSGTRAPPGGAGGEGFYAGSGSTLTVSHAVVDNNQEIGIYALDSGTVATVSDVVVNATLFARNGNFGRGLDCGHGARMTVTRALVSNNHDASIVADGAGTMLSVADSVVRNAQPVPGLGAWGLSVGNGASLQADRMYIDHVAGTGMAAVGAGTVLTVNDSVLHDVSMASVTQVGFGVAVQAGGLFTAERVLIDSATQVGVFAYLAGNLEIFDSVVAHTRARATANVGIGAFGGTLTVARSVIDSNFGAGIQTVGMSSGTVEDSCVRGTQPVGGVLGFGLTLESGGTLTASRTLVTSNSDLGVHAYGAGATASLTDVIVAHTQPTMIGFGGGVEANGAAIDVHRVAVIDVAGFGLASATRQANNTDPIMTSTLTGSDVYVSRVGNSTIRVNETGYMPDGASVSYALHAGTGCVLDLQRATADSAGFGVYNAGGMLHVRTGVIASMLDAAGAVPTSAVAAMTQLDAIGFVGNAQDQVVVLDGLPEASEITAPAPVCPPGGCM